MGRDGEGRHPPYFIAPQFQFSRNMPIVQILVLIGLYFLECTKFDQLILRKIIKIVVTRCQVLTLNAPKSISAWALPPAMLRELTALARFKGAYF